MRLGINTTRWAGVAAAILLAGFFLPIVPAHAQFVDEAGFVDTTPADTSPVEPYMEGGQNVNLGTGARTAVTPNQPSSGGSTGCSALPWNWTNCVGDFIANIIYFIFIGLGSALAYLGAYIFDLAIAFSLNSTAYALAFLSAGWTVVRDIANMSFIFILIYLALTIMFTAETANTLKMLASVIVVALLVNFSFFFTRVVIDAGNIVAVQFYNAIPAPLTGEGASSRKSLTDGIMNALQVQTLLNGKSFKEFQPSNSATTGDFFARLITLSFLYIGIGAIFWILFWTFLRVGITFMVRIAVLWFTLVVSPLAFVAYALKDTRPYATQWQKLLVKHSIYPAVFLFVFLVLTKFVEAVGIGASDGLVFGTLAAAGNAGAGDPGFISVLAQNLGNIGVRLGIVVIVLYYGMKVADHLGVMGSDLTERLSGWATGSLVGAARFAGGLPIRGAAAGLGALGRRTIGAGALAASQSDALKNRAATSFPARLLWRGAGALGTRSFDVRNTRAAAGLSLGGSVAIGAGRGEGGARQAFNARVARREAEAKALKPEKGKIEQAERRVLAKLTPGERAEIDRLGEAYDAASKASIDIGDAESKQQLRNTRKAFNDSLAVKKVLEEVKKQTGANNAKEYAEAITTRTWDNWFIGGADREAAARIRDAKNDAERLRNTLKNLRETTPSTPATPATASASAANPPPAAPGGPAIPTGMQRHSTAPDTTMTAGERELVREGQKRAQEAQREFGRSLENIGSEIRGMRADAKRAGASSGSIIKGLGDMVRGLAKQTITAQEQTRKDVGEIRKESEGMSESIREIQSRPSSPSAEDIAKAAAKINTIRPEPPR